MSTPTRPATSPVTDATSAPGWLSPVLQLDALGCAAIGAALLIAPGWLATGLGLDGDGPVRTVGALFVLAAVANAYGARRLTRAAILPAVELDVAFAAVLVVVAVTDPWGAEPWARLVLVAGVAVCAIFAGAKLAGRTRLPRRT